MDPAETEPMVVPWDTSVGNRFAPYTPNNHSAVLWIVALLGLVYVVGVLLIRVWIKIKVLGFDDWFIAISTVVGVGQSITMLKGLGKGLGQRPVSDSDEVSAAKLVFASRVLLLISLYLAKCSSVFLLRRLFVRHDRGNSLICDLSLGFTILCGIAAVFAGNVGCPSSSALSNHCDGQIMRWSIVTGLDVITEVVALILPPYLVWQLQMKSTYKLRVIAAFCFRAGTIVFSVIYLNSWVHYSNGAPSPFNILPVLIWQQVLLAWSLISATIPNLKAFLQSLSTNWGIDWGYTTHAYGTNGTFELSEIKRSTHTASRTESEAPYAAEARTNGTKFKTEVTTNEFDRGHRTENGSVGSGGSQDLIIRKDTQVVVETHRAGTSLF
ncbi:hypothetical protein CC78DRAFT_521904 [Lojkania enalia]|uniref:Rhodopsin domain-containing protein n=1 Tax=Lojkania enalia TaxID=147567 RepID=A0A9P4K3B8_9PLEO|nr:hypothetical protein CC78DRAFT_521904 [Didymosphaeria enalia]